MQVISLPYFSNNLSSSSSNSLSSETSTTYADVINDLNLAEPCFLMSGDDSDRSQIEIYTAQPIARWEYTSSASSIDNDYWHKSLRQFCSEHLKQSDNSSETTKSYPSSVAIGYLSYPQSDLGHRDTNCQLAQINVYDWYIRVDHKKSSSTLIISESCTLTSTIFDEIIIRLSKSFDSDEVHEQNAKIDNNTFTLVSDFAPHSTYESYTEQFNKVKAYISAGDVYQISLTHAFSAQFTGHPYYAFKRLYPIAQAPYSAYLGFESRQFLSFSPEEFITVEDGHVSTSPIKGTRARKDDPLEDAAVAKRLQEHDKDRAENVMIVDLLRNDLGKVCKTGTVTVDKLLALESYSNVHHLVSTVSGELVDSIDALDALAACFPGGSITGAPKKRAMEIINELEETPRHVYCGAIICLDSFGTLRSNIPIRTILAEHDTKDNTKGKMTCWSGGGIVFDSELEKEYQETLDKINHLIKNL